MSPHLIREMTEAVAAVLPEGTSWAAIEGALTQFWAARIALVWTTDDVHDVCPGLIEAEAMEVLAAVDRDQDASLGVHWDTIRQTAVRLYGVRALAEYDDAEESEDDETEDR